MASISDGHATLASWKSIFGLQGSDFDMPYLVAERLLLLFKEVAVLEDALIAEGHVEPDLYAGTMQALRGGFSPMLLHSVCQSVKAQLATGDTHRTLRMLEGMLRMQEHQATEDEMQEMYSLLAKLQELVSTSALPPALLSMFRSHIELLRRALSEYPISGPRALRDAIRNMRPELFENLAVVMDNLGTQECTIFEKLWAKATILGAKAGTVNDLAGIMTLGVDAAKAILKIGNS